MKVHETISSIIDMKISQIEETRFSRLGRDLRAMALMFSSIHLASTMHMNNDNTIGIEYVFFFCISVKIIFLETRVHVEFTVNISMTKK